jgi:Protein of unknown function (DUF3108)
MKSLVFLLCLIPVSAESLRYTINWASGLSLGEATLRADKGKEAWDFEIALDASIPGFALRDSYRSAATVDLCSLELDKSYTHGTRRGDEKTTFDQQSHSATRETANGGGKTDMPTTSCAKDPLTLLQFARTELAGGRMVPQQTVLFGAPYNVLLEYKGEQKIKVGDQAVSADRMVATIKGPSTNLAVEIFFSKDAARTPLLAHIPLALGTFTVELIR